MLPDKSWATAPGFYEQLAAIVRFYWRRKHIAPSLVHEVIPENDALEALGLAGEDARVLDLAFSEAEVILVALGLDRINVLFIARLDSSELDHVLASAIRRSDAQYHLSHFAFANRLAARQRAMRVVFEDWEAELVAKHREQLGVPVRNRGPGDAAELPFVLISGLGAVRNGGPGDAAEQG